MLIFKRSFALTSIILFVSIFSFANHCPENINLEISATACQECEGINNTSNPSTNSSLEAIKKKSEFKKKLLPMFYLNFDYGSYIVNLTPQFKKKPKNSLPILNDEQHFTPADQLVFGDFTEGFQKTGYGNLEVGLGERVVFFLKNITGIASYAWGYVGVLPLIGRDTESVRYVRTLDKAKAMGGRWAVPKAASDLDLWDPSDSINYVGHGGILFAAGLGVGPIGVSVARIGTGIWETYIEKVGQNKVYVKITRGKLHSLSAATSATLMTLSVNQFGSSDDGFSFLFDLSTEVGRKAYEDMIRGNILASEVLASSKPRNFVDLPPVVKVETFRNVSTGKVASQSFKIPILWNQNYSRGKVNSFTTSELHIDKNTAKAHYGIFSEAKDSRFWHHHTEKDFMFYGAKTSVVNWESKEKLEAVFGAYSFSYRNDQSHGKNLALAVHNLVRKTGLHFLKVGIPDRELGYTGLELNVFFGEENTWRLIEAAKILGEEKFVALSVEQIQAYLYKNNDPYNFCIGVISSMCESTLEEQTDLAARMMYRSLIEMGENYSIDSNQFAVSYGQFGEGMSRNLFVFRTALELAGQGVSLEYLIEGTYLSMYFKSWTSDGLGRWIPNSEKQGYKGIEFNPTTRHSRVRGLIVGNENAGRMPKFQVVDF